MSQIIDWEYYSSHFPTPVPEEKFDAVEAQAEIEFNNVVHPYMLLEISQERQRNTIFQLCNFIFTNQSILAGKAVTSVSNNGYSESYSIQTQEQAKDAIKEIIYSGIGTRLAGEF